MTTKTYAQQCLERAEKATPGPWHIGHMNESYPFADVDDSEGMSIGEEIHLDSATFIAHSRTDVVELAKRLERAINIVRAITKLKPRWDDKGLFYKPTDIDPVKQIATEALEELERPLE